VNSPIVIIRSGLLSWYSFCLLDHPASRLDLRIQTCAGVGFPNRDTELIGFCADFAHQFLSRVSSFVWKNLQITRRCRANDEAMANGLSSAHANAHRTR
jgi:hypothetical protein